MRAWCMVGLLACVAGVALADGAKPQSAEREGWKLVWADEFNAEGLLDPSKWVYEMGFKRNNEVQYYTEARALNAVQRDGRLVITARKDHFPNADYKEGSDNWRFKKEYADVTSASVTTLGKQSFLYGRIEVRAKIPAGQGNWPAIWLLGVDISDKGVKRTPWPQCGEIDVMEHVWKETNTVHATLHWRKDGTDSHTMKGGKLKDTVPYDGYHVYAVEWDKDEMKFFYDDTCYFTFQVKDADVKDGNPFRTPHYLLINLAIGGSWGGKVEDHIFPSEYCIDYVRYYQKD